MAEENSTPPKRRKVKPLYKGQLSLLCYRRRKNGVTWFEPIWVGGKFEGELLLGRALNMKLGKDEVVRKVRVSIYDAQKIEEPPEELKESNE